MCRSCTELINSNVATVLVTRGTLKAGSIIVAGNTWAKVRQMQDSLSRPIKTAPPGTPVSITGWKDLPSAGDQLLEAKDEDLAKKAVTNRIREIERKKMMADVEIINAKRKEERLRAEKEAADEEAILAAGGTLTQAHMAERLALAEAARTLERDGFKELRLVIKGDVSGTVEAVVGSLEHIGNKEAGVKIIHTGVGEVSESDISMAEASRGEPSRPINSKPR
jgi:translation initiation factor IF-2